jgi:hypothetical protein
VDSKQADILQIRKYLNGELNAKAMHDLERRALDDPFLMHAMEGYEIAGADQQAVTDELSVRLQQRISKKERRIIPWRLVSIAASVLIVFSAGVLWLNNNRAVYKAKSEVVVKPLATVTQQPVDTVKSAPADKTETTTPENKMVATTSENKAKKAALADKTEGTATKKMTTVADVSANKPLAADREAQPVFKNADVNTLAANPNIKDSVAKDTTPLNEMVVMGYAQKKKETTNAVTVINLGKLKKVKDTVPEQLLQGQVAGVADNNKIPEHPAKDMVVEGKTIPAKTLREISIINKSYTASVNVIKGRVVASKDGSPVPGATVKVAGTNIGAITDVNGRFALPADSSKSKLVVTGAGYSSPDAKQYSLDLLKTTPVQPETNALAEVVVVRKATVAPVAVKAHPLPGWESFRKYLEEKAVSPGGKTGVVKLSFHVDKSGLITHIKIEAGLNHAANKKAIDLINNGPAWVGNTNGQPETVKLEIKFHR